MLKSTALRSCTIAIDSERKTSLFTGIERGAAAVVLILLVGSHITAGLPSCAHTAVNKQYTNRCTRITITASTHKLPASIRNLVKSVPMGSASIRNLVKSGSVPMGSASIRNLVKSGPEERGGSTETFVTHIHTYRGSFN